MLEKLSFRPSAREALHRTAPSSLSRGYLPYRGAKLRPPARRRTPGRSGPPPRPAPRRARAPPAGPAAEPRSPAPSTRSSRSALLNPTAQRTPCRSRNSASRSPHPASTIGVYSRPPRPISGGSSTSRMGLNSPCLHKTAGRRPNSSKLAPPAAPGADPHNMLTPPPPDTHAILPRHTAHRHPPAQQAPPPGHSRPWAADTERPKLDHPPPAVKWCRWWVTNAGGPAMRPTITVGGQGLLQSM